MAVSLQQTTQIISGVSSITAHFAYGITNKTKIVTELLLTVSDAPPVYVRSSTPCCIV